MTIIVNPYAAGGRGLDRWNLVAPLVARCTGRYDVRMLGPAVTVVDAVWDVLASGERRFVAAGGDGTVNALVNALAVALEPEELATVTLGAVGLGSSNDFHKPYTAMLAGLPARLDFDRAEPCDVGCLSLDACRRWFIVNASAGATANANAFFNRPDARLRLLKSLSTPAAISYAALRTIVRHENVPATIASDGMSLKDVDLTNLAILKSPYFSGNLHYPEGAASGRFSLYLQTDFDRPELVALLMALRRGRCTLTGRSLHWSAPSVEVSASRAFTVEYDGETLETTALRSSVQPNAIRICR